MILIVMALPAFHLTEVAFLVSDFPAMSEGKLIKSS
jgi:hypothetical protein